MQYLRAPTVKKIQNIYPKLTDIVGGASILATPHTAGYVVKLVWLATLT